MPIEQARVPTCVIGMKVGAKDEIDVLNCESSGA